MALIFFSIGNLPSVISLDPKYKNITLTGFEELKYGVLLTPSMLPSTLIFKPPENKFSTFSGGTKVCVETANSLDCNSLHFFLLERSLSVSIISFSETPEARL